jgi:hypothetical protein
MQALEWLMINVSRCIVKEEQTKFISYAESMRNGIRLVKYSPTDHGLGRVYADGALSLQGFSKKIRETLGYGIYHDIDMVNCHPVILIGICKDLNYQGSMTKLEYYTNNREDVLRSIIEHTECSRADAKILMLSLLYGGKASTWKKELGTNVPLPPFVVQYARELDTIAAFIDAQHPDIVGNAKNPRYSKMSIVIQIAEHRTLMCMASFFHVAGYPPGVYQFDGLMVYRKVRDSTCPFPVELLRKCEARIHDETGWNIALEEKDIGPGFDL